MAAKKRGRPSKYRFSNNLSANVKRLERLEKLKVKMRNEGASDRDIDEVKSEIAALKRHMKKTSGGEILDIDLSAVRREATGASLQKRGRGRPPSAAKAKEEMRKGASQLKRLEKSMRGEIAKCVQAGCSIRDIENSLKIK